MLIFFHWLELKLCDDGKCIKDKVLLRTADNVCYREREAKMYGLIIEQGETGPHVGHWYGRL